MNKKLIALLVLVVVLGTVLAGCTMFPIDEERNYKQVVAKVNYEGMTADIYRGDVLTYVVNYGGQYIQNYGMTPEQVVEYFYNNLSKQKLLLLRAKYYVGTNIFNYSTAELKDKTNNDFITVDELRHCVELTNKQFDDLWQSNISALEKEQEANKGETNKPNTDEEDKKEDELAARPVKPEKPLSSEYEDKGVVDKDKIQYFDKISKDKIDAEKDVDKKSNMRVALSTLKRNLEKNFTNYDYFLNQQIEARIVEKYQEALGKTITISDEEINSRYTKLAQTDIAKYVDEDMYASAIEGGTFSLYHTNAGYSKVKSILLSFNQTQKDALKLVKNMDEKKAKEFRNDMAMGTVTAEKYGAEIVAMLKDDKDANKDGSKGLSINVSNPKYDAKEDELVNAYTDRNLSMNVVLYAMADAIAERSKSMDEALKIANITDAKQVKAAKDFAVTEAFVDWTYLVNDDPGMFQNESYSITRAGRDSSYVEEFTILGRVLADNGVGSYALPVDAADAKTESTLVYEKETEMFKAVNGKKATTTVKSDVKSTLANDKEIMTDIYTLTTEAGNSISYIINDFGVHIILVTDKPFNDADSNITEVKADKENPDKVTGYQLGLDYIYDQKVTVKYVKDEDGKDTTTIESVKVETKTIKDYIKDKFQKEKEADAGTVEQMELFKDESKIKKDEKVYKSILKEFDIK